MMSNAPYVSRLRQFLRTPKGALLMIFVGLFALGASSVGWSVAAPHLFAAVLGAVLAEFAVHRLNRSRWSFPSSAMLSGMIVGFVLGPETPHLIAAAVGILATLSKHIVATRRWHVFNPAGLALLLAAVLFGAGQSWWGALPDFSWPFVVVLLASGAFIVDRINKFPLVLTFLGALFGLLGVVSRVDPVMAAELLRAPFLQASLFCALFMLTDPPTAPSRYTDQVVVGALAACASVAAEWLGAGQTYLLVGLLLGNVVLAARRWVSQHHVSPTTSVSTRNASSAAGHPA